jgi:putative endonuclease
LAKHNDLGRKGEQLAKDWLEKLDYEILEENWCFKKSEVDLIAYKDERIVFVEVKTRSGNGFGEPEEFVTIAKQKQLELAANEYIYLMDFKGEIRFDIVSVLFKNSNYTLNHIEDAFWPE